MLDRAESAQISEIVEIDVPVVDLVAALAQQIADHVLARPLGAAGRGDRDEGLRRRKLRIESLVNGGKDSLLRLGSHAAAPWGDIRQGGSRSVTCFHPAGYCAK